MSNAPAFQFYAADFDMDTNTWTNEEVGVYTRLLIAQWVNGPLPDDPKKLSKIARISPKNFQKIFAFISHKFKKNEQGKLQNDRLEETRDIQRKRRESQSKGGKKGAAITNFKRGVAVGVDAGVDAGEPSPF